MTETRVFPGSCAGATRLAAFAGGSGGTSNTIMVGAVKLDRGCETAACLIEEDGTYPPFDRGLPIR